MRNLILLGCACLATVAVDLRAEDPSATKKAADATSATYVITGLHCPPCATTVENSLKKLKGVQTVSVDYQTKSAKVKFDESQLSAQQLAQAIADTPHMMGAGMHYGGLLALSSPDLKDATSAAKTKDALSEVPGVAQVTPFPKQHTLTVRFDASGKITTQQLIEALKQVGLKASCY